MQRQKQNNATGSYLGRQILPSDLITKISETVIVFKGGGCSDNNGDNQATSTNNCFDPKSKLIEPLGTFYYEPGINNHTITYLNIPPNINTSFYVIKSY